MSILDSVDRQIVRGGIDIAITKKIYDHARLEYHEIQRLKGLICSIDYLTGLVKVDGCEVGLFDGMGIRRDFSVIISPETPTLQSYYIKHAITYVEVPSEAKLLGECSSEDKTITLYIYNIRSQGKEHWDKLFLGVYLHEMYHAHFATKEYIPAIEEPIAELGAINALRELERALYLFDDMVFDYYKSVVKYNSMNIYSFGSYIYDELVKNDFDNYKLGPFLVAYKNICATLTQSQEDVQDYLSHLAKNDREAAFKQLCAIVGVE